MALDCLRLWKASCLAGIITTSGIKMPRLMYNQYLPEVLYGCHHQMYRKNRFSNSIKPHLFHFMKYTVCDCLAGHYNAIGTNVEFTISYITSKSFLCTTVQCCTIVYGIEHKHIDSISKIVAGSRTSAILQWI